MKQRPRPARNPFDDREVATRYEEWYSGSGRRADFLEKRLLEKMLVGFPHALTAVEIGCGTGHITWRAMR
jgi:hypothetical protein